MKSRHGKTHGIGLPCVKVVELDFLHLTQTKPTQVGGGRKTICRQERKKEKREKEKREKEREKRSKKIRKKGRRKEGEVGIHSKKVGSFPSRDTLGLGVIQWSWSLGPTWGLVQKKV